MPGKFDNATDEYVHGMTLDGVFDSIGDVQTCADHETFVYVDGEDDYDVVGHAYAIVSEDSRGFVSVDYFHTHWQAMREWASRQEVHAAGCCAADDDSE